MGRIDAGEQHLTRDTFPSYIFESERQHHSNMPVYIEYPPSVKTKSVVQASAEKVEAFAVMISVCLLAALKL
jgi:hypothetical protein